MTFAYRHIRNFQIIQDTLDIDFILIYFEKKKMLH